VFTELSLRNFKGWASTGNVRLAPVTVFFGTNSSGKTSLLQSILLLKQTAESSDRRRVLHAGDDRSLVDLGTPEDLMYKHAVDGTLHIALAWSVPPTDKPVSLGGNPVSDLAFSVDLRLTPEGQPFVESFRYRAGALEIGVKRKKHDEYDLVASGIALKRRRGRAWPLPPPLRFYGFPDEAVNYYADIDWLPDLAFALEQQLRRVHYVGPLREYPKRSYLWAGDQPENVGARGQSAVPALLAARMNQKRVGYGEGKGTRYWEFEEVIADWLKRMGVIHDFRVVPLGKNRKDYEVRVKRTAASTEVLVTDVGFGVSQLLPVLVQSYYAPAGSTVIFEQPEIHLHPKVAADLADVLIDASVACGVQFIVESHSEHFLQRLQRRIAERKTEESRVTIDETHVALYACDVAEGASRISDLQVDEFGNIHKWPKDFFGDPVADAAARAKATIARKKQSA
jgi:predicted ATPase